MSFFVCRPHDAHGRTGFAEASGPSFRKPVPTPASFRSAERRRSLVLLRVLDESAESRARSAFRRVETGRGSSSREIRRGKRVPRWWWLQKKPIRPHVRFPFHPPTTSGSALTGGPAPIQSPPRCHDTNVASRLNAFSSDIMMKVLAGVALLSLPRVLALYERTYHSSPLTIQPFTILYRDPSYDPDNTTLFLVSPTGPAIAQPAPVIYDSTGELVWADPTIGNTNDLNVQTYAGKPVLTMWVGSGNPGAGPEVGDGIAQIYDQTYELVTNVSAVNGLDGTDFHEFRIVKPGNTSALVTAYTPIPADLSSIGGPVRGWYLNAMFQLSVDGPNTEAPRGHNLNPALDAPSCARSVPVPGPCTPGHPAFRQLYRAGFTGFHCNSCVSSVARSLIESRDEGVLFGVFCASTGTVSVSWNGATQVDRYVLYTGTTAEPETVDTALRTVKRTGFETALSAEGSLGYVQVEAVAKDGTVLGKTAVLVFALLSMHCSLFPRVGWGGHRVRSPFVPFFNADERMKSLADTTTPRTSSAREVESGSGTRKWEWRSGLLASPYELGTTPSVSTNHPLHGNPQIPIPLAIAGRSHAAASAASLPPVPSGSGSALQRQQSSLETCSSLDQSSPTHWPNVAALFATKTGSRMFPSNDDHVPRAEMARTTDGTDYRPLLPNRPVDRAFRHNIPALLRLVRLDMPAAHLPANALHGRLEAVLHWQRAVMPAKDVWWNDPRSNPSVGFGKHTRIATIHPACILAAKRPASGLLARTVRSGVHSPPLLAISPLPRIQCCYVMLISCRWTLPSTGTATDRATIVEVVCSVLSISIPGHIFTQSSL
uniref:HMA domain-containing protein n=1 Tax=Mycena chlorophos TaxID=658473 RepID=A0ABQ0LV33_MYCCL|nr:predicted protein [Mycena chlorophos]